MALGNDERGWIMTSLSGVACVLGASIICVDIIVRQFPGKRDFKIQDSDSFLSASLSLSFGVMLFSALYSMLPSAKSSLIDADYDPKTATWIMIACFLAGFAGIQFLSTILHHFMPSHIVDCEHTHDEEPGKENGHAHNHSASHGPASLHHPKSLRSTTKSSLPGHIPQPPLKRVRTTPSKAPAYFSSDVGGDFAPTAEAEAMNDSSSSSVHEHNSDDANLGPRRPSLHQRLTAGLSRLTSGVQKPRCDSLGPCHGFSDLCGSECFKKINTWGGTKAPPHEVINGIVKRSLKHTKSLHNPATETTPLLDHPDEDVVLDHHPDSRDLESHGGLNNHRISNGDVQETTDSHQPTHNDESALEDVSMRSHEHDAAHHHHHVPTNAFLSIGLQTSIAIALHKLPEGFITYATNHANPQLGVSIFLALFIHNITEGFAMALPLYLAINSRLKAMFWSFILGGLSQPLGAGVAALWFKIAGNSDWAPQEGIYGGMFAVTSGIMVSVALQLFSESLELTHSRTLCMVGAITGMGILGISSALTA